MDGLEKNIKHKKITDLISKIAFLTITTICASVIVVIVAIIAIRGFTPFFTDYVVDGETVRVNFFDFLTGLSWERGSADYGVLFIFIDTLYITFLSLLISVPISIMTALFIVRIAPKWLSNILNVSVELLSSVPSIIFGLFGAGIIAVIIRDIGSVIGIQTAGGLSILTTVIVLSMMIMPTITMVSVTSLKAVKPELINGSLALGASKTQTDFKICLTSAKSGIMGGVILGVGRALGEATAVTMVCGNIDVGPTFGLFETTRTLTSTMLSGFHEASGLTYDIRFSVGVVLIILILVTNIILNFVKKRIGKMGN